MLGQLFNTIRDFTAAQPPVLQWLAVLMGGSLPFVESYYGSVIGVVAGVNPVAAIVCAITGNIASTMGCMAVAHKLRTRRTGQDAAPAGAVTGDAAGVTGEAVELARQEAVVTATAATLRTGSSSMPESPFPRTGAARQDAGAEAIAQGLKNPKLRRRFEKYGVPGVCLGSQAIMPSQVTAVVLVGLGAPTRAVARWQCLSIAIWGIAYGSLAALGVGLLN